MMKKALGSEDDNCLEELQVIQPFLLQNSLQVAMMEW